MLTLTPAYGRDYKTMKAARASFLSGEDWTINDFSSPWDGKPVNVSQLRADAVRDVKLRFCGLRKVAGVSL